MATCTIQIKDEVNCKLIDLDLSDRTALVKRYKYEVPGARYQPSVRLGRWDGKVSYFQLGGSTYINMLPEILEYLTEQGYEIELEDIREYRREFEFEPVTANSFGHIQWPKNHPCSGEPMELRDYQVEIINRFFANPQSLQEVATGAGKTVITAALSNAVSAYGRSIVIVPNKSLVTQTEKDYINMQQDVGVYFGDRKELNRQHTICTWQSLNNLLKFTQAGTAEITIGEFLEDVVCVIVDECFAGDSKVLTLDGYRQIKDIKSGDKVINYSETTKEFKVDTVVKQHKNLTNSASETMFELEFDNGNKIQVTGNHKFLTDQGWVRADALTEDHKIINKSTI